MDISHDQSSRWQKFAAVSEEIFEREVQGKTHSCRRLMNSDQSELLPKADIGSAGGHVGFVPIVLQKSKIERRRKSRKS